MSYFTGTLRGVINVITNGVVNFTTGTLKINGMPLKGGSGSPEGSITAPVGSTYQRSNGSAGTTFYVKESGSGNTGWTAASSTVPGAGSLTADQLSANAKTHVTVVAVENLAADGDIAARAIFAASAGGCTLTKVGIIPLGASAGILDADTAVIALACTGGTIVSKTYNTGTQPPNSNVYASLGALANATLTANEVVTLAVTQGSTADLPAFLVVLEWTSANDA